MMRHGRSVTDRPPLRVVREHDPLPDRLRRDQAGLAIAVSIALSWAIVVLLAWAILAACRGLGCA
jgi:hypothetical protein